MKINFTDKTVLQIKSTIFDELLYSVSLSEKQPKEATHLIRKKLKQLRAFLKLLKNCGSSSGSEANRTARDWGRIFSDLRDSHVRMIVLQNINPADLGEQDSMVIDHFRSINSHQAQQLEQILIQQKNLFKRLEAEICHKNPVSAYLSELSPAPDCIINGFTESYQKSFTAFTEAFKSDDPELLHEWRKRLKDFQNQHELLLNPPSSCNTLPDINDVTLLCDLLGELNDYLMTALWAEDISTQKITPEQITAFCRFLDMKKSRLRKKAQKLGNNLYRVTALHFRKQFQTVQ